MILESSNLYDIGTIKKGKDNIKWIVLPNNNTVKWIKLEGKSKIYYTMDNGSEKYKVIVDDKKIIIFILNKTKYDFLTIKKYKNIFIGKSSIKYSPYKEKFIGNSILIEISKNKYVFIGYTIYDFVTKEPILKYESPMGNSSVPYPFAISEKYTYLILARKYISNDEYIKNTDPYIIFYKKEKTIKSYKM